MSKYNTKKSGAAGKAQTLALRQARARKSRTVTTRGGRTVNLSASASVRPLMGR